MLDVKKAMDPFPKKMCHIELEVEYLSESFLGISKKPLRTKSDILSSITQTLKELKNFIGEFAAFDKKYDEYKDPCREA